jgi:hypothetical protein
LNLQSSLNVEPSQCSNTCFLVISLTPASSLIPIKKLPIHRLGKDVPYSHLKPPEGLPHWTLNQVHLTFDITSASQSFISDDDPMLFESSTLLEDRVNMSSTSTAELNHPEQIICMIDVALRLALTNLPPRALSGIKVTERSSFKHLDDICPAMWSPDHIEVFRTLSSPSAVLTLTMPSTGSCFTSSFPTYHQPRHLQLCFTTCTLIFTERETQRDRSTGTCHCGYEH